MFENGHIVALLRRLKEIRATMSEDGASWMLAHRLCWARCAESEHNNPNSSIYGQIRGFPAANLSEIGSDRKHRIGVDWTVRGSKTTPTLTTSHGIHQLVGQLGTHQLK